MTLHELEPGTEVRLDSFRLFEQPKRLQKMHGMTFIVKDSHLIDSIRVYTLEHCESKLGVPYGILREWMFKIK